MNTERVAMLRAGILVLLDDREIEVPFSEEDRTSLNSFVSSLSDGALAVLASACTTMVEAMQSHEVVPVFVQVSHGDMGKVND